MCQQSGYESGHCACSRTSPWTTTPGEHCDWIDHVANKQLKMFQGPNHVRERRAFPRLLSQPVGVSVARLRPRPQPVLLGVLVSRLRRGGSLAGGWWVLSWLSSSQVTTGADTQHRGGSARPLAAASPGRAAELHSPPLACCGLA